jgi:hypothetical protein
MVVEGATFTNVNDILYFYGGVGPCVTQDFHSLNHSIIYN